MTTDFISFIPLDSDSSKLFKCEDTDLGLCFLKQINCFMGANNSGKSRLVRELFKMVQKDFNHSTVGSIWAINNIKDWEYIWALTSSDSPNTDAHKFIEAALYLLNKHNYGKDKNYELSFNMHQLAKSFTTIKKDLKSIIDQINHLNSGHLYNTHRITEDLYDIIDLKYRGGRFDHSSFVQKLEKQVNNMCDFIKNKIEKDLNVPKLYIPILRGMRPLDQFSTDFYTQRTTKDYSISTDKMFSGLSIYDDIKKHLLGSSQKRKLIKEFEEFLSESFFDGKTINLIPHIESDVVYIKEGDDEEREYPIYQLGDGIQALIILTFPLFLRKEEEWAIFIEEPEAHLHPKWQRFFIDTINKYFIKHQFFITTHSNVFLNNKNCSVYHVSQNIDSSVTTVRHIDTQHSEILDELGYKASDLLNANYIVWVEGISDKIYFTQFIKAYAPELNEGIDYTIMMYGGCAQLDHLAVKSGDSYKIQIESMNKNFGFCIDSDNSVGKGFNLPKAKKDFQNVCDSVGKFCWITKVRETENLIPTDIWTKASVEYVKNIKDYAKKSISESDVELPSEGTKPYDELYTDRMKTKVNVDKSTITVNDKIKMAQQVVKIFPKNETDLKKTSELYDNIKKLVEEIKKVNEF